MIHKTKKEEGKKHINMPLRWEFRIFRPDSRQISAFSGMFRPYRSPADTNQYCRYGPILAESARFGANRAALARIEPSRPESEGKKKKLRRSTDARATASDAVSCVGRGCSTLPAASVLSRLNLSYVKSKKFQMPNWSLFFTLKLSILIALNRAYCQIDLCFLHWNWVF